MFGFNLFKYLTESERAYYFNTHSSTPPDYEIVYLPTTLPIRESMSESGDAVSEALLGFEAFGRCIVL